MKKIISPLALILLSLPLSAPAAPAALTTGAFRDLSQKDAFANRVYPKYFAFRGEMKKDIHANYETWAAALNDCSGLMRKFAFEELAINPDTPAWANRYALEHPEKLILLHLNGQARQVVAFPDVLQRYFPGHWVYLAGSAAATAIKATDTTIRVKNAKPFTLRGYADDDKNWIPQNILLVRVDKQGNRLWAESEYAKLTAVDYATNTITLKRGQFFTTPRDFPAGETYIAPIAGYYGGKEVRWFYNLSSACPKDKDGRQAGDIYADEIASWFAAGGPLQNLQGIAFDVNFFDVSDKRSNANWDTNNDGKPDGGWLAGRNIWREGDWKFLARLRNNTGPNFLLTSDAQHAANQQALGIMDGCESEGLVQHDDMWRGFSRFVNTHLYWRANNTSKYDYRYVVLKLHGPDEKQPQQMCRFGIAAASCLEAFTTDPQLRGFMPAAGIAPPFTTPGALGAARGELMRYAKTTKQLFPAGDANETLKNKIDAPGCDVTLENGKIIIRPRQSAQPAKDGQPALTKFTIKNVTLPAGDVTLFLRARALDPLDGFKKESLVPRIAWLRPARLPDYGEGDRRNELYTRLTGMMGTRRAEDMSYYFRRVPAGAQDLEVEVQGTGAIEITSLEIYNAPDIIARRFDNALVLVNPSQTPATLDAAAFGAGEGKITIPALDAAFFPLK